MSNFLDVDENDGSWTSDDFENDCVIFHGPEFKHIADEVEAENKRRGKPMTIAETTEYLARPEVQERTTAALAASPPWEKSA